MMDEANATIEELTLLLLYLSSWEETQGDLAVRRAWRNFRFEVLDALEAQHWISQSRKSVYLTEAGIQKAQELLAQYLGRLS